MILFFLFLLGLGAFLYSRRERVAKFFIHLLKIPEYLEKYEKELRERQAEVLSRKNKELDNKVKGHLIKFEEAMTYNFEEKSHIEKVDMAAYLESQELLEKLERNHWNPHAILFSRYLIDGFEIRYSPIPRNELFFGENITIERDGEESVFELLFPKEEPEKMLFRFIDDPAVLIKALKFPDEYISSVCEVRGEGDITQAKYIEYTYGIAQKDGANYRMKERAGFRYFLDSPTVNNLTGDLILSGNGKSEHPIYLTEEAFQTALEDLKFKMERNFESRLADLMVRKPEKQVPPAKMRSNNFIVTTQERIYYAPAPANGLFWDTNLSEEFIPNESIYKITLEKDTSHKAYFAIVEDHNAQHVALNIPDDYLRPAVQLEGEIDLAEAVHLETTEKGMLQKDDSSWRILRKAVVKYS